MRQEMSMETKTRNSAVLRSFIRDYLLAARKYSVKFGYYQEPLFGCNAPCQVDVIWFEKPSLQVLIFTHTKKKPDMLIQISGPHYSSNAVNTLQNLLNNSRWMKEYIATLPKDLQKDARDIIESEFLSAIRVIQRLVERGEPEKAIHRSSYNMPGEAVIWICEGFLPTMGVEELCDELGLSTPRSPKEEERSLEGWGTFYYPPIGLEVKSALTFKEKVKRKIPTLIDKKSYMGNCGGYKVYIGKDGFVGVLCKEQTVALDILNTIFAFSLIKGIETSPVQPPEAQNIRFNPAMQSFDIIGSPATYSTPRTSHFGDPSSYPDSMWREKAIVRRTRMRQIVKYADKILKDKESAKLLRFFHESYIHMKNHEYNSAFTLAWTIIESWISRQWISYLKSKKLTRSCIRKLTDWNVDTMIQSLYLSGCLVRDARNKLDNLRTKRNKIVHRGQFASKKDVENCVNLAFQLLKDYIPTTKLILPSKKKKGTAKISEGFIKVELVSDLY